MRAAPAFNGLNLKKHLGNAVNFSWLGSTYPEKKQIPTKKVNKTLILRFLTSFERVNLEIANCDFFLLC